MQSLKIAASFIKSSDFILIGAGAGIGKDSGLPDFRGNQGFWNNYPAYKGKFNFYQCANPAFLQNQPNLFWGFYGSRLNMYRKIQPHAGFKILLDYNKKHKKQFFVVTSNVDGHFQKSGFKQQNVHQIHGSIHFLQCWRCYSLKQNDFQPEINYEKMSSLNLPICQHCNLTTRPNILMFNDDEWVITRQEYQERFYDEFINKIKVQKKKLCMIEIGAGTEIPSIRRTLQYHYHNIKDSKLIRINPEKQHNQTFNQQRFVHINMSSLKALGEIHKQLENCNQLKNL